MGEHTKSLHYRKDNTTHDIKLYTSTSDIGEHYISINDNGTTVYAPLVETSDANASDIRVRLSGTTYAVASQYVNGSYDPNPALLLERTRAGTHTTFYNIGDTFDITLNGKVSDGLTFNNETYRAVIIGFDHNKELETGGANSTHLAIMNDTDGYRIAFVDSAYSEDSNGTVSGGEYFYHQLENTNAGGWQASYIRQTILPNFFNALPPEWQAVIGNTTKYEDGVGNGDKTESAIMPFTDKMFIFSLYEANFTKSNTIHPYASQYQQIYEYWKTKTSWGVGSHYGDRKLKIWWTRSPGVAYKVTSLYTALTNSDSAQHYEANFSRGVIPCFAVF